MINFLDINELPEETKDQVRDKVNAYAGEIAFIRNEINAMASKAASLDREINEICGIMRKLQTKLCQIILDGSPPKKIKIETKCP